ncbi:XRE family transcriptional regulator [Kribbella monticola]|uniref:XRE family transcriptional regulator n=1 Tax=Kribbella monticola TaxID=2185285 RepID=UPI000DD47E44|nr:XRE family transcriptional regulator [Kribbella monticola]
MRRFEAAVLEQGEQSPTGASLKRMFAYWESGQRSVSVPVYRRAFVAIYGQSAEVLGFETASSDVAERSVPSDLEALRRDLDRALRVNTSSELVVDDWEQLVERYGRATRDRPAALLLADLSDDLGQLQTTLTGTRSAIGRRRLVRVGAQMSGLMLLTLVKLDNRTAFRRWARTARVASAEAGDPSTQSWMLAQEAYGHFYSNDLSEAITVATQAQEASSGPGGVGAPLAAALEARAYAVIGDKQATRSALGRAEEFVSHLSGEALVPSAFGYNEAQLAFHAGSAYTRLRELPAAFAAQERALTLCAPGDYTDRAMTRLDRAACFVAGGDITASAQEIAGTLLGLDDEQRRGIIDGRAREVIGEMTAKQRHLPVVRELHDLVRPTREEDHQ